MDYIIHLSAMGGTLSVTLSDCLMNKMEKDFVISFKPKFFCRYADDKYNRKNKNQPDELLQRMNKYHPNINLTVEINPSKFLDTKIYPDNNEIECYAYHKEMTLPFHWACAVPKHSKKNVVTRDLHRVKNLSSHFEQEVRIIKIKYIKAGYHFRFINSVIDDFNQGNEYPLILTRLFEERKEVSFNIPFCKTKQK